MDLEKLVHLCERELIWLDMTINAKKSCCIRIGPRCDVECANITTLSGHLLPWTKEIRYLGIFIVQSRTFKCALEYAKSSFYRAANAIFGKIGRLASEEVTLQLIKTKCLPMLLYGLVACPLNTSQLLSIDFVINRFFIKLFSTSNMEVIKCCQEQFSFQLPSDTLARHTNKSLANLCQCDNSVITRTHQEMR